MSVTEARSDAPRSIRCPSCGGLNPGTAQWCGQCLTRFQPPSAPERSDAPEGDRPRARVSPLLIGDTAQAQESVQAARPELPADGEQRGAFRVTEEGILWTCRVCDTENPFEAEVCSVCGLSFAKNIQEPEKTVKPRDPGTTVMFSMFFPGVGHAYLGLWGQAFARATIGLWLLFTAAMGAVQRNGGLVIAIVFGLAALAHWGVTAHDAFRESEGMRGLVILKGKVLLYSVLGLLLILVLLLIMAGMQARGAS